MITDCPDPQEVADFHFRQLRTLKVTENERNAPKQSVNLLASGSKHGLLFVGVEGGFKVIRLEDVLTLDEDKDNRGIAEIRFQFVPCGTPLVLSVNADQTRLAVCVREPPSGIAIKLYALASLSAAPRVSRLSSADVGVSDFSWNPTVVGLFSCCLSDGSLHICQDEGEGTTQVKIVATLPTAKALSVCWSPKGKQLVCGRLDGSFTQYKQSLQEVKTIPPPPQHLDSPSVSSICWIANTVFAVVYAASDGPSLFLVSTPKDSAVVYTNFGDVCLGNNSDSKQKYFFHLEPLWGIFVCASIDSIEIAVLGNMPQWVQWDLREDGKALLPGKDGATHAVGLAVMYSAQRHIQISESEVYPPMPVMFVLTNNGLLISFHMINSREGAASLVSAPLPLHSGGPLPIDDLSGKAPTSDKPPATGKSSAVQSTSSQSYVPSTNYSAAAFEESSSERLNNHRRPLPASDAAYLPHPEAPTESLSSMETSYRLAILSEIQSFEKELQGLKQLQNFDCDVDEGEDMVTLKIGALNLQNFQKDIFETMQSLSGDIYTLKNALLECFVMAEEGSSRERRRNDHSYVTILKERSLDPVTSRRMQGIHRHHQYLAVQLQEINNRLDEEWIGRISNNNKGQCLKNTLCISSTEAVYKTIVNNQKIIHSLKKKVDVLLEKNKEKKLRNTTKSGTWRKYERSTYEDLSKLADEFLNVKVSHQGEKESETTFSKKLCPESQNSLRAFLKESHVVTVRPTAVYSSSQSRLLSSAVPSQDLKKQEVTAPKDTAPPVAHRDSKEDIPKEGVQQKYAPICEPVTPPDDTQSPKKNLFGGTSNETCLGTPFASMPPVSINSKKPPTAQEFSFGISSSSSNREVHRAPLFPPETNIPEPSVAAKTKAQSSSSFFSPFSAISSTHGAISSTQDAVSSTHGAPKSQECTTTSAFAKNGNLFSLAPAEKKDTSASTAFTTDASRSFQQGPPSTVAASISFTTGSSFPPPAVMTPQTSNPLFNVPTSKNSAGVSFFGTGASEPFSFFQKGTTTERATISEKEQIPSAPETSSLVDLLNANVCNLNSSSQQECKTDEPKSPLSKASDSVPTFNSPSAFVVTSNQPSISSTSESKEVAPLALNKYLSDPISAENDASEDHTVIVVSSPKTLNDVVANSALSQNMTSAVTIPPTLAVSSIVSSTTANSTTSVITVSSVPSTIAVSSVPSLVTVSPVVSTAVATHEDASAMPALSAPSDPIKTSISAMPVLSPASTVTLAGEKVTICSPVTSDSVKNAGALTGFAAPSSLFGKNSSGSSFFQGTTMTTTAPAFGQAVSQSSVSQSSFGKPSTFFTQPPGFEAAPTTTSALPASTSDLDNQLSSFSFGKTTTTTFGQTTGGFGLSKSLFGQTEAPPNQSSALTSFSFAQNPAFGQGSFFSGLGGKPSEENASKNVFGSVAKSTADTAPSSNLFGNTGVTSFGAVNSGDGSFGGGGSFIAGGGSVAQSGFGAFQKSPVQQTGGFGTAPAFGGAPAFGSAPAFGASPSFGSGSPLASVFGQQQQVSSNFSSFANASSPTFGSLASQGSTFGSPTGGGGGGGGGTAFGSQGFGAMQSFASPTSSFGNPGSPPSSGSSAFTQWRN